MKNNSYLKLEWAFLVIGAVFGILLAFYNPPFRSNDEDRHFYNVYLFSKFQFVPDAENGYSGIYISENMEKSVKYFMSIDHKNQDRVKNEYMTTLRKEPLNAGSTVFEPSFGAMENPIPFIPHTIFLTVGKFFEDNTLWLSWFARLGGLAGFLAIVFYSIRLAPFYKGFIFVWALTPMSLYQAASVTYDTMNNAISILLIALFLHYIFVKKKMERNDYILIFLLAIINVFSKPHTILLPLLYFAVPKQKKLYGRWMDVLFIIIFPLLYFFPEMTFGKIQSAQNLKSLGLWKDYLYGVPALSLKIHLSDPLHFIYVLYANVIIGMKEWINGAIGRFGYTYTKLPEWFMFIHSFVFIFVAFFESNKKFILNINQKTIFVLTGFITAIIVFMGMFLLGPVGSEVLFGLQGRYFIPAIPLIFMILYNKNFEFPKWEKNKIFYLSAYSILSLSYTVYFIASTFYE